MSCVMKMMMRSSAGSMQNAVLAAPPHAHSPGVPRICASAGDCHDREAEAEPHAS